MMGSLSRQTVVNATVETVFQYVADPHNAPRYSSSFERVLSGPQGSSTVGDTWQVEANFLGQPRRIALRLVELVAPGRVRFALLGEPQGYLTIDIVPVDNGRRSQVSLALDVPAVPTLLLGGLMGGLLAGDVERLKRILEV